MFNINLNFRIVATLLKNTIRVQLDSNKKNTFLGVMSPHKIFQYTRDICNLIK